MKNSGVEWIGEIPNDWEVKPLTSLFSFGKGLPITKEELKENGIPVLSYGQIHSKTNTGTSIQNDLLRYVDESYLVSNPQSLVQRGDFIFADTSEDLDGCGNCAYVNFDSKLFAGYHTVILKSKNDSNNQYLAYLFKTDEWRKQIRAGLVEVKLYSISRKVLKRASVILPPKSTQQHIASYLNKKCNKIEETIQNQQQVIEKLKAYKQSLITEAVTGKIKIQNGQASGTYESYKDSGVEWIGKIPSEWEIQKLNRFLKTVKGFAFSVNDFENDGLPIVKVSDIKNGKIHLGDSFLSEKRINDFQKVLLHTNDILMTTVGSTPDVVNSAVGQLALVTEDFNNAFLNQNAVKLYSVNNNNNIYIYYCLRMKAFREHLNLIAHGTANQVSLTLKDVLAFSIQLPSKEEQKSIADYLDKKCTAIDTAIEQKQKLIEKLTEYKKSLIYECVTGKKEIKKNE